MGIAKRLGEIAEDIKESKNFITYEAFVLMAGDEKYISQSALNQYLMNQDVKVNDMNEVNRIIYRYDQDSSGNITYEEFKSIFFPYINNSNHFPVLHHTLEQRAISLSDQARYRSLKDSIIQEPHRENNGFHYTFNRNKDSNGFYSNFDTNLPHCYNKLYHYNYNRERLLNTSPYGQNKSFIEYPISSSMNNSFNDLSYHSPTKSKPLRLALETEEKLFFNSSPYKEFSMEKKGKPKHPHSNISIIKSHAERKRYFIDLIKEILLQETKCEGLKEIISRISSMNLPDLFSYFDYSNEDHISMDNMKETMHNLGIIASKDEIELLFKRYDVDYDRHLDYSEFCLMLLPRKMEFARMMTGHQPPEDFVEFSASSLKKIAELLEALIQCEKRCEEMKRSMASYPGYSNYEMFEMIKAKFTDVIYKTDLINFLRKCDIVTTQFEQAILMDYFDKENTGTITFTAFIKVLAPKT